MSTPMDSATGSSGHLIYLLPLIAKSPVVESLLTPLLFLLSVFTAIAIVYWIFPGGPAWGTSLLGRRLRSFSGSKFSVPIPGPRGLPVLGSILEMGALAHRRLAELAEQHSAKRLMALSLGSTRMIISSNADVAKYILNSPAFADRPLKQSAQELLFGRAMGFAPYGDYWRKLRRIASGCLFSPRRIAAHEPRRQSETTQMLIHIRRRAAESAQGEVQVRELLQRLSLSCVMWSVFGHELGQRSEELQEMVREGFELLGAFNWSDHLGFLREWDPQGVVQRCKALVPRVTAFVSKIVQEHREKLGSASSTPASAPGDSGDFVDVLLGLQGEDKLSDPDMVAVLWEMIFRGTDTTALLTEWVLAELVLNPEIQRKLQSELDGVCGSRPVSDSDMDRLPYLQAVVNETLRLHPPGPLLSWARLAVHDVDVAGYHVPAGTSAMVNMWAIMHDPCNWKEPEKFDPERFMEKSYDVRGIDLKIAPFGAGRRVCPGRALGLATVRMWVGRLVQEFIWCPSEDSPVDLSEVLKLSCEMAKPLRAKPLPRTAPAAATS